MGGRENPEPPLSCLIPKLHAERLEGARVVAPILLILAVSCSPLSTPVSIPAATPINSHQVAMATASATHGLVSPTLAPPEPSPAPTSPPLSVSNLGQLQLLRSLLNGDLVRTVAFSPNGQTLAAAGGQDLDFRIRLWAVSSGALEGVLAGHRNSVRRIAFSPDGKLLASASADGTAAVWDLARGVIANSLSFPNPVSSVAFSPDGEILAVGGVDRIPSSAVWTYQVASWKSKQDLQAPSNLAALSYSPDGQILAAGGAPGKIRIWRGSSGVVIQMLDHSGQVNDLAISPDGKRLAAALCVQSAGSACQRGQVWIWDLEGGTLAGQLGSLGGGARAVAFAAHGSILLAGSGDGILAAWDSASLAPIAVPAAPGPIEALAVSPDDRYLAVGCDDSRVYLFAASR